MSGELGERRSVIDDIARTATFVFAIIAAGFFLFRYDHALSIVFGVGFVVVGGAAMRKAWFPYGRIVESAFWLLASLVGLVATFLYRSLFGDEAEWAPWMLGALVLYSTWDTVRSIRFAQAVNRLRNSKDDSA